MEVFGVLFSRYLPIVTITPLKQHMKYVNARCKIQLDLPVKFAKAIPVKFATVIPAILTGNEKGVESYPAVG